MDVAEFHTLVVDVLEREAGFVTFGEEQDTAKVKADESLVTLGIELPRTVTLWPDTEAIAFGLNDVIYATFTNT